MSINRSNMKIGKVLLIPLIFGAISSGAQSTQKVLEKHFEAQTQDFWDQARTVTVDGAWFVGSERTVFTLHAKRPNKVILKGTWEGQPFTEAFDGVAGWTVAPWTGVSKANLMLSHEQLMISHLFDFGSPIKRDADLEYKGKVKEDGVICHWLAEVRDNIEYDYFIDINKHYLRKVNRRESVGDEVVLMTKTYDIFKQFGGVTFPTVIFLKTKELEKEYVFDDLVVGDGISDAIFRQPVE